LLEYRLQGRLPSYTERWDPDRSFKLLARMPGQIQKSIHVRNRDPFWAVGDFCNVIARPNLSFLQYAKVKPWSSVCHKQGWHARLAHADADSEARYARLGYFKDGIANAVSVTDADLVISKPLNGEVLSELAEAEIAAAQKLLPVVVGVHLIYKYRALLPTVAGEISLRVAINIELAHHPPFRYRKFPDGRSDSLAVPSDFAWNTDIH